MYQKLLVFLFIAGIFAYIIAGDVTDWQTSTQPVPVARENASALPRTAVNRPSMPTAPNGAANTLPSSQLQLRDVQAKHITTNRDDQLMIISGKVYNQSNQPLSHVLLKFSILKDNKIIDTNQYYAGRIIDADYLQQWSLPNIALYLKSPLFNDNSGRLIVLNPGASMPFMAVFANSEANGFKAELAHWRPYTN